VNEKQTENDIQIVQNLIDLYVTNLRIIILVIVQISNNIVN